MGRFWLLVNFDRREIRDLGKLGEDVFEDIGIAYLLSPPYHTDSGDANTRGTWAGDRLICIGAGSIDCPKGVLSTDEVEEFKLYESMQGYNRKKTSLSSDDEEVVLYNFAYDVFDACKFQDVTRDRYPDNCAWVLRNLSKQEYVLGNAFSRRRRSGRSGPSGHVRLDSRAGLTQAILSRISWSTTPACSCSICVDFNWRRGPWAGDRFDIQPLRDIEEELQFGWKDVSEEVVKPILQQYKKDFHYLSD